MWLTEQAMRMRVGIMTDTYIFPHNENGLEAAFYLTLSLRASGFRTRLYSRQITVMTQVYALVAFESKRPSRKERGL